MIDIDKAGELMELKESTQPVSKKIGDSI